MEQIFVVVREGSSSGSGGTEAQGGWQGEQQNRVCNQHGGGFCLSSNPRAGGVGEHRCRPWAPATCPRRGLARRRWPGEEQGWGSARRRAARAAVRAAFAAAAAQERAAEKQRSCERLLPGLGEQPEHIGALRSPVSLQKAASSVFRKSTEHLEDVEFLWQPRGRGEAARQRWQDEEGGRG